MTQGSIITLLDGQLQVPENPSHYIEGDGIDDTVMIKVVDNAVNKAYGALEYFLVRSIGWTEGIRLHR